MIELTTAATAEPITTTEAKLHLREDGSGQDNRIVIAIESARMAVEAFTGRALINRTYTLKLPAFPAEIVLPYPPVSSVTSVKYIDNDGVEQTLTVNTDYRLLAPSGPQADAGRIVLPYDGSWPSPRSQPDAVRVLFVAGYGAAGSAVPGPIRDAMLLMIGDAYENREAQVAGAQIYENRAAYNLLWPFRVHGYAMS